MNNPDTSLPEEDVIFNTHGTSIDDAFSDFEIEDDCDDMDEDLYDDDIDEI